VWVYVQCMMHFGFNLHLLRGRCDSREVNAHALAST